jgi:hypothetical protein
VLPPAPQPPPELTVSLTSFTNDYRTTAEISTEEAQQLARGDLLLLTAVAGNADGIAAIDGQSAAIEDVDAVRGQLKLDLDLSVVDTTDLAATGTVQTSAPAPKPHQTQTQTQTQR